MEILELQNYIKVVWPEVDFEKKISKDDAFSNSTFQNFVENHVSLTLYSISIKKCLDVDCIFHDPPNMPLDVFKTIQYHCTPTLKPDENNKYYSFDESYGKYFDDLDCPSLQPGAKTKNKSSNKKPPFQLQQSQVRLIFNCSNCGFPRLFYAQKRLSASELEDVNEYLEDINFTCGDELPKYPLLFQQPKAVCNAPVKPHYFTVGISF